MQEIKEHIYSDFKPTEDVGYSIIIYQVMWRAYHKTGIHEFTRKMLLQYFENDVDYSYRFADGKLEVYADILSNKLGLINHSREDYRVTKMSLLLYK